ncbi:SDR family NAD(P)-dependent oxidoreductase [Microbacterium sp.]|uniref:SDR family NAD(P)-dependent oxidoreductase n=1 Tax=Microbacterium sp. TaxID=51671 RepID=UPI0027367712|nr:SDR family oxidoreductase [Microbacterium sp.]MDP3950644.1 SDR family oxidoreductase [Microbacterium sp.]
MIDLGLIGAKAAVIGAGYIPERAGIGRAVAMNLARAGAAVACIDLDPERAESTAQAIRDEGGVAHAVVGNVLDSENITRAIDESASLLDGLDTVVDVIGTAWWSRAAETTDEDWERAIKMNLTQVFYALRASIPHLVDGAAGSHRGASFTALSSIDGMQSSRLHAAYGAAKAGVISLAQSFAEEYGPVGVRVNTVAPGNVGGGNSEDVPAAFGSSDVNPLAPPRAQDIADAVLYLSSKLASRVTGQNILVDGGARMANTFPANEALLMPGRKPASYAEAALS